MNRITMITLGVADLDAARAFYEDLGWIAEDGPPGAVFFDCGGYKLGLFGRQHMAKEQGRAPADLRTGATTVAVNWPSEAEVDAAFAGAIRAGGTALTPPVKMPWGGYSGCWSDPDGHVWEYAFNPFWPLDGEGRLHAG